ncbi:MAG: molecular chaperone DnaJ [Caldisericia bacterium]|nr:molecular chaperone DnaJ [Caldisericia bacterium]MDD4615230.1 molecular chaperone DnaJ [Caldisericia bacterium]
MANIDFYEVLGVDRNATPDEIKSAYRRLVMKYHPDVNKDADSTQRMTEINEAYDVLSDPKKKQKYDMYGTAGLNETPGSGGYGEGFSSNMNDFFRQSGFSNSGSIFDDIFSAFSGGNTRQQYRTKPMGRPGSNIPFTTDVTFKEAIQGKKIKINLDRFVVCESCGGSGAKKGTTPDTCSTCKGGGYVQQQQQSFFGVVNSISECPTCGGTGKVIKDKCPDCNGFGRIRKESTIELDIPPSIPEGTRIRYPGYGNAGINGGAVGDLIVSVRFKQDTRYIKDGSKLIYKCHIPFTKAILGTTVSIPTIEGSEKMKILPGTQSGEEVVLKGKGLPNKRNRRDDMVVRIVVDIPASKSLNKNQRKALEELDQSLSLN